MSCCGQTAVQALAAAQQTLDARTAAQTHVRLVYTGQDKRVRPFVAAGKVYQFGNNERRRTNVVAQAAVPKLLAMGVFEVFDPEKHNEDGSPKASPEPSRSSRSGEPSGATNPDAAVTTPQPTETSQAVSEAVAGESAAAARPPLRPEPLLEQTISEDKGLRAKAVVRAAGKRS